MRALGVSIALDDFGTGYSSLRYLQKFPFHMLKIDRAFVASLGVVGNAGANIQSIVTLGHALGMKVLAEGVENDDQRVLCGSPAATRCRASFSRGPVRPPRSTGHWRGLRARGPADAWCCATRQAILSPLERRQVEPGEGRGRVVRSPQPPVVFQHGIEQDLPPAAHSSKLVDSASLCEMPPAQGTKIIVVGATRAT